MPGDYLTKTLVVQLRSELQAELIPLIGAYSCKGLKYDELPANNEKIAFDLLSKINEKWKEKRGATHQTPQYSGGGGSGSGSLGVVCGNCMNYMAANGRFAAGNNTDGASQGAMGCREYNRK